MQDSQLDTGYAVEWVVRRIVGIALLGAAFVHFAAAPPHLDEQFSHGMFFVVVGWTQFLLGVFLLAKPRSRAYLVAIAAINLAIVVVWIVSRTAGIDGPAETVGFGDAFSVVLEVVAIAGAFALGTQAVHRAHIARGTGRALFGATTCVVAGAFVFALSGGLATGHDHVHVGASGDGHEHGEDEDGHDHGNPAMGAPGHDHAEMLREEDGGHVHVAGEAHASDGADHGHDGSDPNHAADHESTDGTHAHLAGTGSSDSHAHGSMTGGSTHPHGTTDASHDHDGTTDTTHNHGGTTDTTHNHGGGNGTTPTTHDHGSGNGTTPTTHGHGGGTQDWETTRRAALIGGLDQATYDARLLAIETYLFDQIRIRSDYLRTFTGPERRVRIRAYVDWTLEHALDGEHGIGNHAHGIEPWETMNAATTRELVNQLRQAESILPYFPTAAHAMAAGYIQVTPWMPGIGAHYLNAAYLFAFDPLNPAFLLYNGNSPTSVLVGVSYAALGGSTAPTGFAGPNDHWHEHPALCLLDGTFVIGADHTPAELCESVGAVKSNGFFGSHLWMMHLWQVPGWSSSWGLFSGESPAINFARTDIR